MFEKYNEKARRALFFARYEASKLGSRVIESEHILLGVLREGEEIIKEIFSRFNVKPEQIRREVEGDRLFVDRISSSAELPLSEESKKILAYAPHEEQSDSSRRARRRQDGDRRRSRTADRRRQRAPVHRQQANPFARSVADRRRHEVPRPVRRAAQGHHQRAERKSRHHHLHR